MSIEEVRADARRSFWSWWRERRRSIAESAWPARILGDRDRRARALQLLKENLSSAQRDQFLQRGYFDVIGGTTGKRYRIKSDYQMNVEELDSNGTRVCVLCFAPEGQLELCDIMLAQKVALELFEPQALVVANVIPARFSVGRRRV